MAVHPPVTSPTRSHSDQTEHFHFGHLKELCASKERMTYLTRGTLVRIPEGVRAVIASIWVTADLQVPDPPVLDYGFSEGRSFIHIVGLRVTIP